MIDNFASKLPTAKLDTVRRPWSAPLVIESAIQIGTRKGSPTSADHHEGGSNPSNSYS